MKAAIYDRFQGPIEIAQVSDPEPPVDGVVIQVGCTGICRSDWHGWMGHDADIQLPHIPGHELAGEIVAVGKQVRQWRKGQRVTLPFALGCGTCPQCRTSNQHICDNYWQPGFSGWGSFAEFVAIRYADVNLVELPETMSYFTAALLGCRFSTSYRAVTAQGKVKSGEWVAVHGCGGVGLSAVMIAKAFGGRPIAIDINTEKLRLAKSIGAELSLNASKIPDIPRAIKDLTLGGAQLSVDALGSHKTCRDSILSLRKRGRHVQIGLLSGTEADPPLPMAAVIANELELIGSHGMQAHQYRTMLNLIMAGKLDPQKLLERSISLQEATTLLPQMDRFPTTGVLVIDQF